VSGLMEQSGPRRSHRSRISRLADAARSTSAASVMPAISGLAGSPPTTARPVAACAAASVGLPGIVANESAVTG